MSRFSRLTGLTAAAALTAVTAGRFVVARTEPWPPPTIAVTPNAGGLAARVSVADFSNAVVERLRRFTKLPVRGSLDAGRDRLRAWDWTYLSRSAVLLYGRSHDARLIG